MLIECLRDMRLVIVYRTQLSMFFFHIIDLLLRPMFREMSAIWIQQVLDECGGADLNEIRGHNRGCFQLPGVVVRIMFGLYLRYIRNNRNPKDSDFFQSYLFVSVKENIVQVTNPRSLILNVHDDRIFQNEPIVSRDDGQRTNPFQRLIGGGADIQTYGNISDQFRHFLSLLQDHDVAGLDLGERDCNPVKQWWNNSRNNPPHFRRLLNGAFRGVVDHQSAIILKKPVQNATKCNPTRRVFRAFGSHVRDQILLHSKMNRIGMGYFVERLIQNILRVILDYNVQLMWDAPNLEHKVVALLLEQGDNSSVSTDHHVLPVRANRNQFGAPIWAESIEHGFDEFHVVDGQMSFKEWNQDHMEVVKHPFNADSNALIE